MKRFSFSLQSIRIGLIIFSWVFSFTLYAQEKTITVLDGISNEPLQNVLILDQDSNYIGQTHNNGSFQFNSINPHTRVYLRLFGYESYTLSSSELSQNKITAYLFPEIEELETIFLTDKKRKTEILYSHFELWEGGIVAVSKTKKKLIILNHENKPLYQIDIPVIKKDRLNTLFMDADQRIYLLGEQHALQLYITNTSVYKYQVRQIAEFNKYIKNLKLITHNDAHIYRNLERVKYNMPVTLIKEYTFFNTNISFPKYHNCGTDFIAYQKDQQPKTIFTSIDTNNYYAADREFGAYVSGYIAAKGSILDRRWGMQQHSYNTLFGRFREIPLFNYHDKIVVFDVFNNQLVHLNHQFETDTSVAFDLTQSTHKLVALQDLKTERIWLFERQKQGRDYLIEIDNGLIKSNKSVFIDSFSRNVRIQNNWIYFLNEKYLIERKAVTEQLSLNP